MVQLEQSLNKIGAYTAGTTSSAVNSLADLGLTFDQSGNLQFDSSAFSAASAASPSAVSAFLGSETNGGFIQSAYSALTALTATTTGAISVAGDQIGSQITNLTTQISTKQAQVNQLQTTLTAQMAQADSAISSLQGQLSEITNLFSAETQAQRNITG